MRGCHTKCSCASMAWTSRPRSMGRSLCFFGPTFQCTRPGEECCESRGRCYFPESEPEYCDP